MSACSQGSPAQQHTLYWLLLPCRVFCTSSLLLFAITSQINLEHKLLSQLFSRGREEYKTKEARNPSKTTSPTQVKTKVATLAKAPTLSPPRSEVPKQQPQHNHPAGSISSPGRCVCPKIRRLRGNQRSRSGTAAPQVRGVKCEELWFPAAAGRNPHCRDGGGNTGVSLQPSGVPVRGQSPRADVRVLGPWPPAAFPR